MSGEFSYTTPITDYYALSILPCDEDGEPVLTLEVVRNPRANILFQGPEIAALHRALRECEMAASELDGVAKRMGMERGGNEKEEEIDYNDLEIRVLRKLAKGSELSTTVVDDCGDYFRLRHHGLIELASKPDPREFDPNRRAWYYTISDAGRAALAREEENIPDAPKPFHLTPQEVDLIRLRRMAAEASEQGEELSDDEFGERPRID